MSAFNFRSGADAAEHAAQRTSYDKLDYLSLKDGEHAYIRMLSGHEEGRGFITIDQHFSPTRPAPEGHSGNWPAKMPATCRKDVAFQGSYADCFLCNKLAETGDDRSYKTSTRSWALGVVRVPHMVDGRQVGMVDDTMEIERDGEKLVVPKVVYLNFAWSNFFVNMANTYSMNGTWCDRDHYVQRKGNDKDTDYPISAQPRCTVDGAEYDIAMAKHEANPAEFPNPGEAFDTRIIQHAGKYLFALGISPEDMASKYNNDPQLAFQEYLEKIVVERSTDEYYARLFDIRVAQPKSDKKADDGGVSQAAATPPPPVPAQPQPNNDELAELAARVQGMSGYGSAAPEPATSAPA
jgi:hypothetical protein